MKIYSVSPDFSAALARSRVPLAGVLRTRAHTRLVTTAGVLAAASGWWVYRVTERPLWQAVASALVVMVVPLMIKWHADAVVFDYPVAAAAALVVVQGLHLVEHGAQVVQRHLLNRPLRQSNGLLSPANGEWVHFVWNWSVLLLTLVLFAYGMRGVWGVLLLLWTLAHTLEHTYLFVRFHIVRSGVDALGFPNLTTQGLAGIVGSDGWLDRNGRSVGFGLQYVCQIPFVTTATRVDAHAGWNIGETLLLIPAANAMIRTRLRAARPSDHSAGVADDQLDG